MKLTLLKATSWNALLSLQSYSLLYTWSVSTGSFESCEAACSSNNILWENLPSYCIITWNNLELAIVLTRVAMSHHYWKLVKLKRSNIQPTLFPSAHKEIGRGSLFLPLCVLLWSSSCPLTGSHTTIYTFAHIHFSWTGYHFLHGQN